MTTQVESDLHVQNGEITPLIGGIIDDARQLLIQQLTLFQVELKHDLQRNIQRSIPLVVGVVLLLAALVVLAISAALLLCWIWPEIPAWAGFAIIGGLTATGGAALLATGVQQIETVTPPAEKSVEALKENLSWKTKT